MRHKEYGVLFLLLAFWTVALGGLLVWSNYRGTRYLQALLREQGRAFFQEIVSVREWNAGHGGVYVPVTEATRPNPYLLDDSARDLETTDGRKLTRINPAYMTRQIAGIAAGNDKVGFHITSLNPIRPANKADEWERVALESFARGEKEHGELLVGESRSTYRYMAPVYVKPPCLACHEAQGYSLRDVRGGISVTLAAGEFVSAKERDAFNHALGYGGIWLVGFLGISGGFVAVLRKKRVAEEASRLKDEFLANISHELRTPLNGIMGMTELTMDTELTGEQRSNLEMVRISSLKLLHLLNDILDFSKMEAGRFRLGKAVFDPREVAAHVVRRMDGQARQKGLDLRFGAVSGLPLRVVGDELRVNQVLTNLLDNAVKFTRQGVVELRVELAEGGGEKGEHRIHFSVSDTGMGIPGHKLNMIFDSFTQADGSLSRSHGGTGLGLAIVKRLVDLMGGEVWVESEEGKGSVFHFIAVFGAVLVASGPGDSTG